MSINKRTKTGLVDLRALFQGVYLAEKFESLIRRDSRFEIPAKRHLGLVVFRLVGDNIITENLCKRLNSRGKIHCVPASLKGKYVIRFTVTSPRTTLDHIVEDWKEILKVTDEVFYEGELLTSRERVPLGETKERNVNFGSSLLLSNSPMSPKIVNGSFAAIYDQGDVLAEFSKTIKLRKDAQDSPAMRRRIKGILMSGKQFSLDSRLDLFHGIEQSSAARSIAEPSNNLPVLEDEIEERSSSPSEINFEVRSPDGDSFAETSYTRQSRSKSVDNEGDPLTIKDSVEMKPICSKCGHRIPLLFRKEIMNTWYLMSLKTEDLKKKIWRCQ
ncbi:hypothetical protein NQ318_008560, partial [Aromia moschata]